MDVGAMTRLIGGQDVQFRSTNRRGVKPHDVMNQVQLSWHRHIRAAVAAGFRTSTSESRSGFSPDLARRVVQLEHQGT